MTCFFSHVHLKLFYLKTARLRIDMIECLKQHKEQLESCVVLPDLDEENKSLLFDLRTCTANNVVPFFVNFVFESPRNLNEVERFVNKNAKKRDFFHILVSRAF